LVHRRFGDHGIDPVESALLARRSKRDLIVAGELSYQLAQLAGQPSARDRQQG
jgi:hypothetical protein